MTQVNVDKIKQLVEKNKKAKEFFELLSIKQRNRKYTTFSRIRRSAKDHGTSLSSEELKSIFSELQSAGAGHLEGSGKRNSKFAWDYKMIKIADMALGGKSNIEKQPNARHKLADVKTVQAPIEKITSTIRKGIIIRLGNIEVETDLEGLTTEVCKSIKSALLDLSK